MEVCSVCVHVDTEGLLGHSPRVVVKPATVRRFLQDGSG